MVKEESVETMLEFMYNKCLRCDYKDCKKKEGNIEELEVALQKIKNKHLQEMMKLTNIRV